MTGRAPSEAEASALHASLQRTQELARRYELLLGATADGVYGLDVHGRVTFANPAAARMTGFSQDQLIGQDMHTSVHAQHPDGAPYASEDCPIRMVIADGQARSGKDEVFLRQDGSAFPVEYTAAPLVAEGQIQGAVVVFRDISAQRQAAQSREYAAKARRERAVAELGLRALRHRGLDALAEAAAEQVATVLDAPWAVILQVRGPDEALAVAAYGVDAPAFSGGFAPGSHIGITLSRGQATAIADLEAGEPCELPLPLQGRMRSGICAPIGGSKGWWGALLVGDARHRSYSEGEIAFVQAVANVVATAVAREAYDQLLAAEAERLAVTLRSIGDGVITTDVQGVVTMLNGVAEALTGWPQAEARGHPAAEVFRILDEGSREPQPDPVAGAIATGEVATLQDHALLIDRAGAERVVAHTVAPIRRATGEILGAVLVFRDETASRQLGQERERAGKLEALGLVAGGVAHDFNNLLTVIRSNLELARARSSDETTASRLADAVQAAERASGLTSRLLAFARGEQEEPPALSIVERLEMIVRAACASTSHDCALDIQGDLWMVNVPSADLDQVVQNLVGNALQAMESGGRLQVRARNEVVEAPRGDVDPGRWVIVEFQDQGRGIPEADLRRVFDPFYTTKPTGTGLGLATVWDVLERHGGTVEVESEVGVGTTFLVWFPVGRPPLSSVNPREVRRQARDFERLQAEHSRLLVTLRAIGDGVIVTDEQARVTLMNPVAEEGTGWSQSEALGRSVGEVFHIEHELDPSTADNPVFEVLRTRKGVGLHDHTVLAARGGERHPIAHTASPIMMPNGDLIGTVLVFRDMRARRRLDEELLKTGKLEVVGQLAGRIAHDYNNVLAAILGGTSLALRRLEPEHAARRPLETVLSASRRAQDLTQELVTFARGGAPVREAVDVLRQIEAAAKVAIPPERWTWEVKAPPDLWFAHADPSQLRQVLQNLMRNAVQAMPDGGLVTICAANTDVAAPETLPLAAGRYVGIDVIDHGAGIPAEELSKIFDPFYTTRPNASGLGLASVHSIISAHGGYLSAESKVGESTRFHLHIPAADDAPRRSGPTATQLPKGRVLVMDDEPDVRATLSAILEDLGFEVAVASDGEAALDLYRRAMRSLAPFDLVVLDVTIPSGMGGERAIAELRVLDPAVRAIVSSGYSDAAVLAEHRTLGFAGVLHKPYTVDEVVARLSEVLGTR